MGKFQSTKLIGGYSTCFRQWKSAPINCSYTHGYFVSFKLWFEGELEERNWATDFGFLKRSKTKINWSEKLPNDSYTSKEYSPNEWLDYMFDHTTIVASNDPQLNWFKEGNKLGILRLRIVENVGCERFAELVYKVFSELISKETNNRVKLIKVEFFENEKNSAIYIGD